MDKQAAMGRRVGSGGNRAGAAVLERTSARGPAARSTGVRLQEEIERLGAALQQGRLGERGRVELFTGMDRSTLETVNTMVDAIVQPLLALAAQFERISQGEIPPKLTETRCGEFKQIKDSLDACIDALGGLTTEMKRMADEHTAGDIDVFIPVEKFQGAYRVMAQGVNDMVAGHIAVKKKAMACVAGFSQGNFDAPLEKFPGKKAFINENIERLRNNIQRFMADMKRMSDEHNAGDIDVYIPAEKFEGAYR